MIFAKLFKLLDEGGVGFKCYCEALFLVKLLLDKVLKLFAGVVACIFHCTRLGYSWKSSEKWKEDRAHCEYLIT